MHDSQHYAENHANVNCRGKNFLIMRGEPVPTVLNFREKNFVVRCLITKILCRENLELYGTFPANLTVRRTGTLCSSYDPKPEFKWLIPIILSKSTHYSLWKTYTYSTGKQLSTSLIFLLELDWVGARNRYKMLTAAWWPSEELGSWQLLWRQWGASPSLLRVPAVVGLWTNHGHVAKGCAYLMREEIPD